MKDSDEEAGQGHPRIPGSLHRREGPNGEESEARVRLGDRSHQKPGKPGLPLEGRAEGPSVKRSDELPRASNGSERSGTDDEKLLELVVERSNVEAALRRVKKNKGSAGIDGMTVDELPTYVAENWSRIREELLAGRYQPKPVRRHAIPKRDGGVRELGIPTALDRVANKALVAMKDRVRDITKRSGGRSIASVVQELRAYLVGWKNYFQLADTPNSFLELDQWIRHRLRAIHLKQWKRGTTIFRELVKRGMRPDGPTGARRIAANCRRWWRNSGRAIQIAFPNSYFDVLGLPRLAATSTR